jgi:hypothetical protein
MRQKFGEKITLEQIIDSHDEQGSLFAREFRAAGIKVDDE